MAFFELASTIADLTPNLQRVAVSRKLKALSGTAQPSRFRIEVNTCQDTRFSIAIEPSGVA
jgi:hypothetical protein